MEWFDNLSLKNKAITIGLSIALILFILFGIYIDIKFTSYKNMKTGNRVEITN